MDPGFESALMSHDGRSLSRSQSSLHKIPLKHLSRYGRAMSKANTDVGDDLQSVQLGPRKTRMYLPVLKTRRFGLFRGARGLPPPKPQISLSVHTREDCQETIQEEREEEAEAVCSATSSAFRDLTPLSVQNQESKNDAQGRTESIDPFSPASSANSDPQSIQSPVSPILAQSSTHEPQPTTNRNSPMLIKQPPEVPENSSPLSLTSDKQKIQRHGKIIDAAITRSQSMSSPFQKSQSASSNSKKPSIPVLVPSSKTGKSIQELDLTAESKLSTTSFGSNRSRRSLRMPFSRQKRKKELEQPSSKSGSDASISSKEPEYPTAYFPESQINDSTAMKTLSPVKDSSVKDSSVVGKAGSTDGDASEHLPQSPCSISGLGDTLLGVVRSAAMKTLSPVKDSSVVGKADSTDRDASEHLPQSPCSSSGLGDTLLRVVRLVNQIASENKEGQCDVHDQHQTLSKKPDTATQARSESENRKLDPGEFWYSTGTDSAFPKAHSGTSSDFSSDLSSDSSAFNLVNESAVPAPELSTSSSSATSGPKSVSKTIENHGRDSEKFTVSQQTSEAELMKSAQGESSERTITIKISEAHFESRDNKIWLAIDPSQFVGDIPAIEPKVWVSLSHSSSYAAQQAEHVEMRSEKKLDRTTKSSTTLPSELYMGFTGFVAQASSDTLGFVQSVFGPQPTPTSRGQASEQMLDQALTRGITSPMGSQEPSVVPEVATTFTHHVLSFLTSKLEKHSEAFTYDNVKTRESSIGESIDKLRNDILRSAVLEEAISEVIQKQKRSAKSIDPQHIRLAIFQVMDQRQDSFANLAKFHISAEDIADRVQDNLFDDQPMMCCSDSMPLCYGTSISRQWLAIEPDDLENELSKAIMESVQQPVQIRGRQSKETPLMKMSAFFDDSSVALKEAGLSDSDLAGTFPTKTTSQMAVLQEADEEDVEEMVAPIESACSTDKKKMKSQRPPLPPGKAVSSPGTFDKKDSWSTAMNTDLATSKSDTELSSQKSQDLFITRSHSGIVSHTKKEPESCELAITQKASNVKGSQKNNTTQLGVSPDAFAFDEKAARVADEATTAGAETIRLTPLRSPIASPFGLFSFFQESPAKLQKDHPENPGPYSLGINSIVEGDQEEAPVCMDHESREAESEYPSFWFSKKPHVKLIKDHPENPGHREDAPTTCVGQKSEVSEHEYRFTDSDAVSEDDTLFTEADDFDGESSAFEIFPKASINKYRLPKHKTRVLY